MVWTRGLWTVKAGREAEFVEAWREFATWTQAQFPGSHAWLLRQRDAPSVFMSIGPFASDDVVTAWRGSAGFVERVARIRQLLERFEPDTFDLVVELTEA